MKKINNTIIFTIITLVLLLVPSISWIKYLDIYNSKLKVKFELTGYDPIDVLKGNYVRISYLNGDTIYAYLEDSEYGAKAYVTWNLEGEIENVSYEKPSSPYYLVGSVSNAYGDEYENIYGNNTSGKTIKRIYLDLPTKYYTNAENAKKLEKDLSELNRLSNEVEFKATLKIKNGVAIISDISR